MIKQIHLKHCDSTQDILKEQLSATSHEGVLVSTDRQLKGKGRGSNSWEDLPGSLCFSLSLKPHPVTSLSALEVSLLIVDFFALKGKTLFLKWPNDLWTPEKKKCGGVLLQGSKDLYLAGIGLNLFSENAEYGGIFEEKSSLEKESLAAEISEFILTHRISEKETLQKRWLKACGHLDASVQIIEGDSRTLGVFKGIGEHGEAILETETGLAQFFNGSLRLRDDSLSDGV